MFLYFSDSTRTGISKSISHYALRPTLIDRKEQRVDKKASPSASKMAIINETLNIIINGLLFQLEKILKQG